MLLPSPKSPWNDTRLLVPACVVHHHSIRSCDLLHPEALIKICCPSPSCRLSHRLQLFFASEPVQTDILIEPVPLLYLGNGYPRSCDNSFTLVSLLVAPLKRHLDSHESTVDLP